MHIPVSYVLWILLPFIWLLSAAQGDKLGDEFDLKNTLMARYIPTVRPVKDYTSVLQVSLDLALRALVDLDEKNQVLTSSTWIRVYWKDEFLVWNPANYSNIQGINFLPSEIWVPDIVLYNSADATGRGLLDTSMKTHVQVKHDGSVSWLCPLVLKSECTVDITYFPFDKQSCPLHFGLWTYDGLKVNLSLLRKEGGDLGNYLPSGEFDLDSMPGRRDETYYVVSPNVPFPYIMYHLNITRRTKFYLMNIIWPGILIALLAALCYLLPPECGERIGLGITSLLAMMVFLLMISESIPPTSDAIPLASKFFTSVLVLSAFTLLTSAIVITFTFYSTPTPKGHPWFVRVFINKWLARLVFVKNSDTSSIASRAKAFSSYKASITVENNAYQPDLNDHMVRSVERYTKRGENSYQSSMNVQDLKPVIKDDYGRKISEGMAKIIEKLKEEDETEEYKAEWRKAAKVVDRVFLVCFLVCLAGSLLSVYVEAPEFYVP